MKKLTPLQCKLSDVGKLASNNLISINILSIHAHQNKAFFTEVKVELQKASWPWDPKEKGFKKYKELIDSTLVVIIAMLLLGGYVALLGFYSG